MANLFEIISELQNEENYIDMETGELNVEYLDNLNVSFNTKVENIIKFIKNLKSDAKALKEQEDAFKERRKNAENKADRLTKYLFDAMKVNGNDKLEFTSGIATIKKNPPSVNILDEEEFIRWAMANNTDLLKVTTELNKTEIKDKLKLGEELPFVELKQDQSLSIK